MNDRLLSSWILVAGSAAFAYYYWRLPKVKAMGKGPIEGDPVPAPKGGVKVGTPSIVPRAKVPRIDSNSEWFEWPSAAKAAMDAYRNASPAERKAIMDRARRQILRSSLDIDGGESTLANQVS